MSFRAVSPFIVEDTIPKGFNTPCEDYGQIIIALALPTKENATLGVKISPKLHVALNNVEIGYFQVESEFFIIPPKDIDQRNQQIYNLVLTAVLNLNDFFAMKHDIPSLFSGKVFYQKPDFEKIKKAIEVSFMTSGNYGN